MRIIITGGMGFIGQNLARYLRRTRPDAKLISIDWFEAANPGEKAVFDENYVSCFCDDRVLDLYRGADVLVHLAAYSTVQDSISDPQRCFINNVVKTQMLLEFLRLNSPATKIIFASTGGAIIGDGTDVITEQNAPCPISPYGASKLAVEGLLSAYAGSYGMNAVSLRFSNIYGPWSWRQGNVISRFCKSYLRSGQLRITGDGLQTRDYMFADDASKVIDSAIEKDARGVYQLGTGIGTSILELADIFCALDPLRPCKLVFADALVGEVRHNRADITKARRDLGFVPEVPLDRGVRMTLDWFQRQIEPASKAIRPDSDPEFETHVDRLH